MDTSETYIKMCEKEEKIQALRPQVMIDSVKHYYKGVYQYEVDSDGEFRFYRDKFIWLPRQDQLQEMLGNFDKCQDILHEYLSSRVGCPMSELWPSPIFSMEQLWFALVMKEKYNETWDGVNWR